MFTLQKDDNLLISSSSNGIKNNIVQKHKFNQLYAKLVYVSLIILFVIEERRTILDLALHQVGIACLFYCPFSTGELTGDSPSPASFFEPSDCFFTGPVWIIGTTLSFDV